MRDNDWVTKFMAFLLCTILTVSQSTFANTSPEPSNENKPPDPVSLQLKWLHQFQFAGYYAAKFKGFYADEGLDVTIKERDIYNNNIQQVIDGESEYGVADSMLMLYQAKSAPVTIIAPILQHSPQVFITLKSSGLDSLYKLESKNIAFYRKDTDGFPLLAMLKQNKVSTNLNRMQIKSGPEALIQNDVQAYPAYLSNEPFYFKKNNIPINIIHPMNYGVDLYGDLLFTHTDELKNHPERVERFRRATLKGWRYALEHEDEVIDFLINVLKINKSREHLKYEASIIKKTIEASAAPLGTLDAGRLEFIKKLFINHSLIKNDFEIANGIYKPETHKLLLTKKEMNWITNNPEVTVAVDNHWAPIEFLNNKNEYSGMAKGYFDYLSAYTGIKFIPQTQLNWSEAVNKVKQQQIDMFSAVISTPERQEYVGFTKPYLKLPMVIATQKGENYIKDLYRLNGKTIAVVKDYAAHEFMKTHYPAIQLSLVTSTKEGLDKVSKGLVYGYVDNVAVIGHQISEGGFSKLQITGETPFKADVSMAIRHDLPILKSIIEKALNSIDAQTHTRINSTWLQVHYKRSIEWQQVLMIVMPIIMVLLIIMLYNRKLQNLNKKLSTSNIALLDAQVSLEDTNQKLERLTVTDFLTGAYNRKHIDNVLSKEISRSNRYDTPLSIIIIDLDNFKQVNDSYGHLVGDEVLKAVFKTMKHNIRQSDTLARWGGEEFLIISPSTHHEHANALAEKIRVNVENIQFSEGFTQTISAGVATYQNNETLDKLVERADNYMYQAKHQGKNQVVGEKI